MGAPLETIAVEFLRLAAGGHAEEAFARYVGPGFRHHNPFFRNGADALRDAMNQAARANPTKSISVKQVLETGNRVSVLSHVQQNPEDRGVAVVHLFRFEDGKIVELWDVGQPIPEKTENDIGMF